MVLAFDLKQSKISWYDETKPKDRAGMVAKAIREHLTAAKADSSGSDAKMTLAKWEGSKEGSKQEGLGGAGESKKQKM